MKKFKETQISDTVTIKELDTGELEQAFPVLSQLRTHLTLEAYLKLVKSMVSDGYRIICLFENGNTVAYAGFAAQLNLYYGAHIWVYDLVTDKARRGCGYGKLLLSYIEKYAKDNFLSCVALSSGLQREDAHKFYENSMDYQKTSYVFKKLL